MILLVSGDGGWRFLHETETALLWRNGRRGSSFRLSDWRNARVSKVLLVISAWSLTKSAVRVGVELCKVVALVIGGRLLLGLDL